MVGWMRGEEERSDSDSLLTYICLFVVLDELGELKVSSNDSDLETEDEKRRGHQTGEGVNRRTCFQ